MALKSTAYFESESRQLSGGGSIGTSVSLVKSSARSRILSGYIMVIKNASVLLPLEGQPDMPKK